MRLASTSTRCEKDPQNINRRNSCLDLFFILPVLESLNFLIILLLARLW